MIWDKFISSLIPFLRIKILLDEENSACLKMYSYRHAPCVPPGPKTVVAELRWGIKLEHFGEMCSLLFPPHTQHENYWWGNTRHSLHRLSKAKLTFTSRISSNQQRHVYQGTSRKSFINHATKDTKEVPTSGLITKCSCATSSLVCPWEMRCPLGCSDFRGAPCPPKEMWSSGGGQETATKTAQQNTGEFSSVVVVK